MNEQDLALLILVATTIVVLIIDMVRFSRLADEKNRAYTELQRWQTFRRAVAIFLNSPTYEYDPWSDIPPMTSITAWTQDQTYLAGIIKWQAEELTRVRRTLAAMMPYAGDPVLEGREENHLHGGREHAS